MWKFSAYITTKDGKRIYAKSRGLKAFCFWVDEAESLQPQAEQEAK